MPLAVIITGKCRMKRSRAKTLFPQTLRRLLAEKHYLKKTVRAVTERRDAATARRAGALDRKPHDLVMAGHHHSAGNLAWKIANGRGQMPAWKGVLSENEIWDLVNFTQSLGGGADHHKHHHHHHSKEKPDDKQRKHEE